MSGRLGFILVLPETRSTPAFHPMTLVCPDTYPFAEHSSRSVRAPSSPDAAAALGICPQREDGGAVERAGLDSPTTFGHRHFR